jgi:succinoglycan biosynthesis protein ExoO
MNYYRAPNATAKPAKDSSLATPEVSFIMAARNVADYVEAAIASALNQTFERIEIVVVDDASDDATADKVATIACRDRRVSLIRNPAPVGPARARNQAIAAARGKWVAVLDGDDLITPERTEYLLHFADCVECDIVSDNSVRFEDGTGIRRGQILEPGRTPYAFTVDAAEFLQSSQMFSRHSSIGYLKPMFRAEFLRRFAIAYDETVLIGEDFVFCLDCLIKGARYFVLSEGLYFYRIRTQSMSRRLPRIDIEKLISAQQKRFALVEARSPLGQAAQIYSISLDRALSFTRFVEALKGRQFSDSARLALVRPDVWPLLLRFGFEAVLKRLPPRIRGAGSLPDSINFSNFACRPSAELDAPTDKAKIAICICTDRQPEALRTILKAIDAQKLGDIDPNGVVIIIIDNDPEQSAGLICAEYAEHGRFLLQALHESNTSSSDIRNVALDAARRRHVDRIVFVDDDKIPDRCWLMGLERQFRARPNAVVCGPVYPLFANRPPRWAVNGGFFSLDSDQVAVPNRSIRTAWVGNTLLSVPILDGARLRFAGQVDEADSGDPQFLKLVLDKDLSIAWSDAARAWGRIPTSCISIPWLLRRAYQLARLEANFGGSVVTSLAGRCTTILGGILKIGAAGALTLGALVANGWREPSRVVAHLVGISRGAGQFAAAFRYYGVPGKRDP